MVDFSGRTKILVWALLLSSGVIVFGQRYEAGYLQRTPPLTIQYAQSLRVQLADRQSDLPASNLRPEVIARTQPAVAPTPIAIPYTIAPAPVVIAKAVTRTAPAAVTTPTPVTVAPRPGGLTQPSGSPACKTNQDAIFTTYASKNWAGYVATSGGYTSVKGSWQATRPGPNGATASLDATWIGIGGFNTTDLIQVGTTNQVEANGNVQSTGFYELLPAYAVYIPDFPVKGGDQISASITQTTPGKWIISMLNQTTGRNYSTAVTYDSGYGSAEWIQEDPSCPDGNLAPLDHFLSVNITGATTAMGTQVMNVVSSQASSITLIDANKQPIATTSALGADGASFSVTQR